MNDKRCLVYLSRIAEKQLKRFPLHIQKLVYIWVQSVEEDGIRRTRTRPGYHDEPLSGGRKGQRSIRLSRAYRLIYEESENGHQITIMVLEVNKHEY
jgi:proteic killer suppression protein